MKRILDRYVAFVRQPDVAKLLLVALVSRMPIGMVGFSMLMFMRDTLGNFAQAGAAVGANFITMAAAAPIVGRIIDRHGPRRLMYVTGIVQPLALIATLYAAKLHVAQPLLLLCAGLSGAFASPITTVTRTTWRHRFDREEDRRTAFALDSVLIEINFTVGPAIIAALLATVSATFAFAFAIAVVFVSFVVFMASPALRYFKHSGKVDRHLLGPLVDGRLRLVLAVTFGLTVSFGFLEVGYPAYATALGMPAVAGVLLGLNSLGSAVGGAIYGGIHPKMSIERQFATAMAVMSVPLLLHALVTPVAAFAVVAFLAGALIAPSVASQSVLVSRLAPVHYATEAFTWSSTFIVSGLGVGMALGGAFAEAAGPRPLFAVASALAASMALLALLINAPRAPEAARAET